MRAKLKKLLVSCTVNPIPPLHLSQHQSIVAKYRLCLYSFTQWWVSASYNTYNIPLWWNMGCIYFPLWNNRYHSTMKISFNRGEKKITNCASITIKTKSNKHTRKHHENEIRARIHPPTQIRLCVTHAFPYWAKHLTWTRDRISSIQVRFLHLCRWQLKISFIHPHTSFRDLVHFPPFVSMDTVWVFGRLIEWRWIREWLDV